MSRYWQWLVATKKYIKWIVLRPLSRRPFECKSWIDFIVKVQCSIASYDDGISNSIRLQKITESRNITSPFDIGSKAKTHRSYSSTVMKEKNRLGFEFFLTFFWKVFKRSGSEVKINNSENVWGNQESCNYSYIPYLLLFFHFLGLFTNR